MPFSNFVLLLLTGASVTLRSSYLMRLPRSPHRDTPEFASGWRQALIGHSVRDCPYASKLRSARWQDGFEAAVLVLANAKAGRGRVDMTGMEIDLTASS